MREESLRKLFEACPDVWVKTLSFGEGRAREEVVLTYCELLCDLSRLDAVVLPRLHQVLGHRHDEHRRHELLCQSMSIEVMEKDEETVVREVFEGSLLLLFERSGRLYKVPLINKPQRNVEESNTEVSIRGPRDGFIEELHTNLGLIRKRLRSPTLTYEMRVMGRRTKTQIAILSITDITNQELLKKVIDRIDQLDVDMLTGTAQLSAMIGGSSYRLLPTFSYTGRPEFAVQCLLKGRIVILVDGEPTCLIAPVELTFLWVTAEDNAYAPIYVMSERSIRVIGLFFALFLPAFWNALTVFHQDQLPFRLLATLTFARTGVPMPSSVETFVMLFLFEMFREAGARLPKVIGQTLSVVGGLIIGEAAIRAGLTSPGLVVIVAISVVATSTLVHHSLVGVVSLMRIVILVVSAILGMYGVILCFVGVVLVAVNVNFMGMYYLESINLQNLRQMFAAILFMPFHEMRKRPTQLQTQDDDSGGGS